MYVQEREKKETPMDIKNFAFKLTAWVASEIVLNLVGLDDVADYSEFLQKAQDLANAQRPQVVMLAVK